MTKYKQIKEYVDDHMKYYAFYPYDIVLNMDTDTEETLTYEQYWHFEKQVNLRCASLISGTLGIVIASHATIIVV